MKKKKKLQNQQIILNQDTSIKFYNNFLTFCSLNSFRLKYYYFYLKYGSIFGRLNSLVANNFYTNFYLMRIIVSNQLNLQFFYFYESFLLQKFVDAKNLYLDNAGYVKYFSKLNALKANVHGKGSFFNYYKISVDSTKELGQASSLVRYSHDYGIMTQESEISLNFIHFLFLNRFLFFIFMLNTLNIYRLTTLLTLYKINN
jgi:hypothetical protein